MESAQNKVGYQSRHDTSDRERHDPELFQRAGHGDSTTAWKLALRYSKLANRQLGRYMAMCYGATVEDLRQQALIGIAEAARRYDPSRGSFVKTAKHGIRHSVIRYLIDKCNEIRVPVKSRDCYLKRERGDALEEKEERAADRAERIIEADFFGRRVPRIPADSAEGARLHECDPLEVLLMKERALSVRRCLSRLNPREQFVLRGMFYHGMQYKEIGAEMFRRGLTDRPLSREAVCQYRLRALKKLRAMMTET